MSSVPQLKQDDLGTRRSHDHYSRIPLGPSSIRLLRLFPYKTTSEITIECELFEYNLHDSEKGTHLYEALSYTWGASNKPRSISVNGEALAVTENLYAALLRLRDRSLERFLWIDAICIDQGNVEERGQQVRLMAGIYTKASRVLVWLGETADNSDKALLEIVRIAAANEPLDSRNDETIQQAILALLKRSWFQRIWILQEVAAARHILMMCGSIEIDGYAFYLGVNQFYKAFPNLESLARSVTYLMKGAIFRPKYTSPLGRTSLDISPLSELVDMFHTHDATERVDKVYALLGLSSDDPSTADLLPDYKVPWKTVFENLVKFVLSKQVHVRTLGNDESVIIKSRGSILGKVVSTASDDRHKVNIEFRGMPVHQGHRRKFEALWTLQPSAKYVRKGDIVCLLQGARMPIIIRPCHDYFTVIRITVALTGKVSNSGNIEWPDLLRSITTFPLDFLLFWSWKDSVGELQEPQEYETLIRMNNWVSEYPETELRGHQEKVTRMWEIAIILDELEEHREAEERIQEVMEGNKLIFEQEQTDEPSGQHGRTPHSWSSGNGYNTGVSILLGKYKINLNLKDSQSSGVLLRWAVKYSDEAVVKLLLATSEIDTESKDKDGQTPLSWAAKNGHEAVVKLLLDSKADTESKDRFEQTPLSWAAKNGHEAVVKLLLDSKADTESKDEDGQTPLSWAAENGHEAVVKLLLDSKADTESRDEYGRTPLSLAAENGHEAVVKLLHEHVS